MSLPPNVHISTHPCLHAKLSQLRSATTNARDTKLLVHEIATMIGYEALSHGLSTTQAGTDESPLGYTYARETISPAHISLVPILRSGLGMVDALQSVLPDAVPIFHLGMYREKSTLQPVEYYNNLPYHTASSASPSTSRPSDLAILLDPIIATGATASAAIDTLRDWGVGRIIVLSVLASQPGLAKVAEVWREGVEVFVGGVDEGVDGKGMIEPGLGDVGDRLFGTIGK
ncbi:putative uracil phosphoribosyltransferase [Delphinella strobiligena]|nr:putative uracil phosphoribosyltransferase [Delphinella strobiligena]